MMLNKILKYRKGRAPGDKKMPSAKHLWRLQIGMLKPTLSIRAFALVQVRARKARGLYGS